MTGIADKKAEFWRWIVSELDKRYEQEGAEHLSYSAAAKLMGLQIGYFSALINGRAKTSKPGLYVVVKFKELCPDIPWDVIMNRVVDAFGGSEGLKPAPRESFTIKRRHA